MTVIDGAALKAELEKLIDAGLVMHFVEGHVFHGRFRRFPHLCPGEACAIRAWLQKRFR